jgi:hypothetical protein
MLRIDTAFPTGNGVVVASPDDTIILDRDIRDSIGDRWYWHIRLRPSASATVHIRTARPLLLGQFGPAVSRGGVYEWLRTTPQPDGGFEIEMTTGAEIRICATLPYGPNELDAFRRRSQPHVDWRTLTTSEQNRPVPILAVPSPRASTLLVLTARHHACEATASYVLEGAVDRFVAYRHGDHPAARRCDLLAVPVLDIDGVHQGDQGKGRRPWDHNRDYGANSRYHAVAALRSRLAGDTRPTFALDLHTPGLRGPLEERPYVVASGDPGDEDKARELLAAFTQGGHSRQDDQGDTAKVLTFEGEWNSVSSRGQRSCSAWMRSRPANRLGLTIEYPNAVDRKTPITPHAAREFGATLMRALLSLI